MNIIKKGRKPYNWIKTKVQKVAADEQVRSAVKQAVVALVVGLIAEKIAFLKTGKRSGGLLMLVLNVGLGLVIPNRYKLVKTVGAIVVGAIAMRVKKAKEKKRFANLAIEVA